jgi:phosphomethylpyrimidine synthase
VLERGGVEEYDGRDVKPEDNGGASGKHLAREFPVTGARHGIDKTAAMDLDPPLAVASPSSPSMNTPRPASSPKR